MRLARFGEPGGEKPGIVTPTGDLLDASPLADDYNRDFFNSGGLKRLSEAFSAERLTAVQPDIRIGPPVVRPGKILCIGLNYREHAKESGATLPDEPLVFMKAPNTVIGPNDSIIIPRGSTKTDWEVELAVIIGRDAHYLDSPEHAPDYIAGYAVGNDVSEREFQKEHSGQWTKGKSSDSFCPLGPWLVTTEEIPDPRNLSLKTWINGELRQDGNTSDMVFDVFHLVWYLSRFMTLEAGDVLMTGTPPGVGMGMNPPAYLASGDVVEMTIAGFGRQRCKCIAAH